MNMHKRKHYDKILKDFINFLLPFLKADIGNLQMFPNPTLIAIHDNKNSIDFPQFSLPASSLF
jgi:hypothetical protein